MKALFLTCILVASASLGARAQMAPPPAMTAADLDQANTGTTVRLVVRVESVKRSTLSSVVLNRVTETTYALTKDKFAIYAPTDLRIIMGSYDDIKPGAILYVFATVTKPHAADATKIVVLTQVIKVQ